MLEVVIGRGKNIFGQQQIQQLLKNADLEGTLYLAYPIIAAADQMVVMDSLLTCREHGVVIVDFETFEGRSDLVRAHQDDLYTALQRKLLQYRPLLAGRNLSIQINVLTLVSDDDAATKYDNVDVVGPQGLMRRLREYEAISADALRLVNAAIQRVSTIKPASKRSNVSHPGSRGSIMQQIERAIANLDQWQKRAAIETPDGPQRVRGLAGSGKTVVLALKAAYLHTANPTWNIVVTFNTRALYQQFRDLIRRFCFDAIEDEPDWTKLRILHAWGSRRQAGVYAEIAAENDRPVQDFGYAKQVYSYETAFQGVCDELLTSLKRGDSKELFDAILIDEAQDLPRSFFELAYLSCKAPNRVVYAYDELQNLGAYSMMPPSELFGVTVAGEPRVPNLDAEENTPRRDIVLPICYRNTPWALTVAHAIGFGVYRKKGLVQFFEDPHVLEEVGYRIRQGSLDKGRAVELERRTSSYPDYFPRLIDPDEAVTWHKFQDVNEQALWIAQKIKTNLEQDELRHTDILVILSNPVIAQKQAVPIMSALADLEISSHLAGVTSSVDSLYEENSVAISGIYRAKGNEAAIVYIAHGEYAWSPYITVRGRNTLFTAITRSRAWVRICGVGPEMDEGVEELQKVKDHKYRLSFNVPTTEQLEKLRRLHRDKTDSEIAKQRDVLNSLQELVAMAESGDFLLDEIPQDLKMRLGLLLEPTDDSE